VGNETKSPGIKSESESGTEILDLSAFLSRLEAYIQQLRRAELPATSLMVEAIGLRKENASLVAASWDETVAMVQKNLRGLDIVCQFRPFTLAIFMPGCSLDLGVERAAKIVHTFNENVGSWKSNIRPERLAISVGGVMDKEEAPAFLDRMEAALEEAGDASPAEVVVHNGDATHFQQV
jgi:GGDEF domain-containing protein